MTYRHILSSIVLLAFATLMLACAGRRSVGSVSVIPSFASIIVPSQTVQFSATAFYIRGVSGAGSQTVTDQVTWASSTVDIATIDSSGLATAVGEGETTITATLKTSDGPSIGTATLDVLPGGSGAGLPSLTVYSDGQGTGTVASNPSGINCGTPPGCTGYFVMGSAVTLTATPASGSTFGGWSSDCQPDAGTACTVTMNGNQSVGVVFNKQ